MLSGACLAIPLRTWHEVGGFPERFFLYHEDVDLSLRLRLRGGTLGIEPAAVVDHDYEFGAREHKWRWLERNRLAFLVRAYPTPLLILLAPALLATELALLAVSVSGGWGRQKLAADLEFAPLAPPPPARAPPDPVHPHRHRRRVRLLAHPRPRLPLHLPTSPLPAGPPASAELLAPVAPAAACWPGMSLSCYDRHPKCESSVALRSAARSAGSGSR